MQTRLFVGNLPWQVSSPRLKEAFAAFGALTDCQVVLDRNSGRSRGFGFVEFEQAGDAARALERMDGADLYGSKIRVKVARPRES